MNINEAKTLLAKYNESTRKQYEKTLESAMKAVNTTNLYEVYNNIDSVYEKMKGGAPGYLSGYFSHLKRVMLSMTCEQRQNINPACIDRLGRYANKTWYNERIETIREEPEDEEQASETTHDECLMEHKIKELNEKLAAFQRRFDTYVELMDDKVTLLNDLIMQLLMAPDRTHAVRSIAKMALDKITGNIDSQLRNI
jgi:hypothetical protein